MAETAGAIFCFDWEMQLMEWLQAHIGSSGFGFWLLSNLSAIGEQDAGTITSSILFCGTT